MLAYDLALRRLLPAPQQHQQREADVGAPGSDARAVRARLQAAAHALPEDPDVAALLLDGVLCAIAALVRERHGDPLFGLRLRLALRAPNVEARLAHCRDLLRLIDDEGGNCHVR